MSGTYDLRGKRALVTGASRGLGAALARGLAARGASAALVARDPAPLAAIVAEIRAAGGAAYALPADVGEPDAAARIAGQAAALLGGVDVLVHNASTLGPLPLPALLDLPGEEFERVLQVNLLGPFRLTRALAGAMALQGGGLVLHVSSDAAVSAYPGWGAYGVSKAALDHLSRSFAAEIPEVRFLSVDPGEMDTQMHADALPDADPATLAAPAAVAEAILALIASALSLRSGAAGSGSRVSVPEWLAKGGA